jgi:DNA-binding transcriptional ArsR family regulator
MASISLDATFGALSDGTRRAILERLGRGVATVGDLAAPHPMSLTGFMKHLRVLESADLIKREKAGRTVWVKLNPRPLEAASDWVDRHKHFWEGQLDSLAEHFGSPRRKGR